MIQTLFNAFSSSYLLSMSRFVLALCLVLALTTGARDGRAEPVVPQSREQVSLTFAPLVKRVTPAVVNIYTKKMVRQHYAPFFDDPVFRQFFGDAVPRGMTRERMESSLGSGVIVRADGLIVTSRHVIADADEIRVVLSDRREFDAKVILADERTDLALLRVESKAENFSYMELRDSDETQVGDLVLAIGNPFGVGQTVTMGIVSALTHKSVGAGDLGYFIQTDAAINPGNSGGALVGTDGKLIGINSSIYSRSGGYMGIGFAVPSNMVKLLMNAVSQGKDRVVHPWTGVEGQEVTQDIALSLGLSQPSGVIVKNLHSASPAAKAGLKAGDVIVAVNGKEVDDPEAFKYRIAGLGVGATADLTIVRKGERSEVRMQMVAPPEEPKRDEALVTGRNPIAGARIANLSPAVADELNMQGMARGVVVVNVKENTLASRFGLQSGDILAAINGQKVDSVDQAIELLRRETGGWRMTIRRGGNEITMMFN